MGNTIVKCVDCGEIFFMPNDGVGDIRSFEEYLCEDCKTEWVWRLQHYAKENIESI